MSRIILIETSTSLCSTALVEDGKVVCERISDEPRAHASKTALFVSEMLSEKGLFNGYSEKCAPFGGSELRSARNVL